MTLLVEPGSGAACTLSGYLDVKIETSALFRVGFQQEPLATIFLEAADGDCSYRSEFE